MNERQNGKSEHQLVYKNLNRQNKRDYQHTAAAEDHYTQYTWQQKAKKINFNYLFRQRTRSEAVTFFCMFDYHLLKSASQMQPIGFDISRVVVPFCQQDHC
jgi:hypothetical protein